MQSIREINNDNRVYACEEIKDKIIDDGGIIARKGAPRKTEIRKCAYCGKDFTWSSAHPNQKYCCKECREWATKNRTKGFGGNALLESLHSDVYLKVTDLINKSMEKTTDFSMQHVNYWDFGVIPDKIVNEVLERDHHECQVCKSKNKLQVHHIIKQKNGGKNTMDNLVTLCSSCHRHIEIGDIPHAVDKCFENIKKEYLIEDNKRVYLEKTNEELRQGLFAIFKKIEKNNNGEYNHILTKIDNVIEKLSKE